MQHTRSSFKEEKRFCLLPKANSSRNTQLFFQLKKLKNQKNKKSAVYCLGWKCLYLMRQWATFCSLLCSCFKNKDSVSGEMPLWVVYKSSPSSTRGTGESEWNPRGRVNKKALYFILLLDTYGGPFAEKGQSFLRWPSCHYRPLHKQMSVLYIGFISHESEQKKPRYTNVVVKWQSDSTGNLNQLPTEDWKEMS